MNYEEWIGSVPQEIKGDPLWNVKAYRLSLFAADLGWRDVTKLLQDKRTLELSDQLYRAIGSVSANLAEGYSRGSGKDRVRFYEYALGSSRESRGWYYNGRHILSEPVAAHRIRLQTEITRLLLAMIPDQRSHFLQEDHAPYLAMPPSDRELKDTDSAELLMNVPMPA